MYKSRRLGETPDASNKKPQKTAEDLEDYKLAVAVLKRVRNVKEQVYSSADIRIAFGLEN